LKINGASCVIQKVEDRLDEKLSKAMEMERFITTILLDSIDALTILLEHRVNLTV
jgi:hypothetical protein